MNQDDGIKYLIEVLTFLLVLLTFIIRDVPIELRLTGGIVATLIIIYIMFRLIAFQPKVIIQKDSLRFNKYPLLLLDSLKNIQGMPNKVYSEIIVENCGKVPTNCSVEIMLKGKKNYSSKILSSDSTDSSNPNPINVIIDAHHGTKGFHPLCLRLINMEVFLPNYSKKAPGAFDGTLVEYGNYEMFGRVFYNNGQSKKFQLGKIKIPEDFTMKAQIPNDIQVRVDQGGFAVFLERNQDKVRAIFYGHVTESDIMNITYEHLNKISNIDEKIENNGRLQDKPIVIREHNI